MGCITNPVKNRHMMRVLRGQCLYNKFSQEDGLFTHGCIRAVVNCYILYPYYFIIVLHTGWLTARRFNICLYNPFC